LLYFVIVNCFSPLVLHCIVVRWFVYASDTESHTGGSVATGTTSLAGQVKGQASDEERHHN
jgi:hypothetical protein